MNWGIWLAQMLLDNGPKIFTFCETIIKSFSDGKLPTPEQWAELRALAAQNSTSQMNDTLARFGIDPTSDQGKAFLALTGTVFVVPTPQPKIP
jgi:hypothetical protein